MEEIAHVYRLERQTDYVYKDEILGGLWLAIQVQTVQLVVRSMATMASNPIWT